jgi:alkylation response protein AidB-like acyl-CoA dehydrogenase
VSITFDVSPATRRLIDEVREWSVDEIRPLARQADRTELYPRTKAEILETCPIDLSPLCYPGLKLDTEEMQGKEWVASLREDGNSVVGTMVMEALNYGDGWGWQQLAGAGIGEIAIDLLGTPDQIEKWVGGVFRGEYNFTSWGMTEPTTGSDVSGIAATAVKDGEDWILNGTKRFISNGSICDYLIFFATIDPALGNRGLRAFIVEKGAPGWTVPSIEDKLGLRYTQQARIEFNNVRVPDENMLRGAGGDGSGTMQALATFNRTRPYCCAWGIGIAQASIDYVKDYLAQERKSFAPHRWSRIEDTFDSMNHQLDQARRLVWRAAWIHDMGLPDAKSASQAKSVVPQICEQMTLRAMQLMGPDAASEEHLLEKWYRDVKLMDVVEGPPQIQKITVSRTLLRYRGNRG